MDEAIPAAVRPTTARFMQDGPGPTGPRSPAVPNSRKPEKYFFKVIFSSAHYDFKDLSLKTVNDKNKKEILIKYKTSRVSITPRDILLK
jgi:hypothetical protein